ncbi:MAG: YitT family protein [Clostridia bacterium]
MSNPTLSKYLKRYFSHLPMTIVASCLLALAMHMFIIPAKFAPGGVSGLASLIQIMTGFPVGYALLILNAPLIVAAFFFIRKRFAIETLTMVVITTGFTELFRIIGLYQFVGEPILAALAGGVMNGAAIGIMLKLGASTGGGDILAVLIQKKHSSLSISWVIFALNCFVVSLAGILYLSVLKMEITKVISIVLFSFITLFINSKTMEILLNGFSSAVKFEVITSKPEELSHRIIETMHRGVTIVDSRGGYTNAPNNVIFCIVLRRQVSVFRKLLKEVDPSAFAYSIDTREVMGNGFND